MNLQAVKPDLVVYLQCSVERLLSNITKRGRSYEKTIEGDYLVQLSDAYTQFFQQYDRSPLLIVNVNEADFVQNSNHLAYIEQHIFKSPVEKGSVYITPR